jgi:hypothetical protein
MPSDRLADSNAMTQINSLIHSIVPLPGLRRRAGLISVNVLWVIQHQSTWHTTTVAGAN